MKKEQALRFCPIRHILIVRILARKEVTVKTTDRLKVVKQLLTDARVEGMQAERAYIIEELWQLWGGGSPEVAAFLEAVELRFPRGGA
jgi:hypothetical protein